MESIKVRYGHWPPWGMGLPTGNGTAIGGVLKDIYEALSSSLKYQFQIGGEADLIFGERQPDGTYNGMIGELARKEIDIGGPFAASEERAVVVDFTNSLGNFKMSIITGIQSADRNMFLYFKVFAWKVWLFLILTVVFCALISILIYEVSVNGWKANQGLLLARHCWVFWSYLIGKNAGPTNHWELRAIWYRHSFRILLAAWLLGPVIISLYTFQGKITSTFAVTKLRPAISGLEELRSKRKIIPVTSKGSAMEICFKTSKDYSDIYSRMRNDSIVLTAKSLEDTLSKVEKGTHVFFIDYHHAMRYASDWVKTKGRCSLQVEELSFCESFIALGIRKGFQRDQKRRINSQLTYIMQAKLTDRWVNRILNNYTHCTQRPPYGSKPLDITDVLGGFLMWAIGIAAAIVVLIAEIITYKTQDKKQKRIHTSNTSLTDSSPGQI